MQKHVRNYTTYFNLGIDDVWSCERCKRMFKINGGLEIHHIVFRSHGGSDNVDNCVCLCRECHTLAHQTNLKQELTNIVNNR